MKRVSKEQMINAIIRAGGAKEFLRLMEERRSNPGAKLIRDEDGKYHFVSEEPRRGDPSGEGAGLQIP